MMIANKVVGLDGKPLPCRGKPDIGSRARRFARSAWNFGIAAMGLLSLALYVGAIGFFLVRGMRSPFDALWTALLILLMLRVTFAVRHGLRGKPHEVEKHIIVERNVYERNCR